jgi:hypothetical protein
VAGSRKKLVRAISPAVGVVLVLVVLVVVVDWEGVDELPPAELVLVLVLVEDMVQIAVVRFED